MSRGDIKEVDGDQDILVKLNWTHFSCSFMGLPNNCAVIREAQEEIQKLRAALSNNKGESDSLQDNKNNV